MWILLFFIEFALIFFLSHTVSQRLSQVFLFITRSQKITIYVLSFLFLPGIIVHELSHWLMASLLFVKTGDIEFVPQIHGDKVKLGSVAVAKTDPVRRFFIGIAPIIFGLLTIFSLYLILFPRFSLTVSWKEILFLYLLFEIGNTMYSSSKDMEGAIEFFAIVALLFLIYFLCYFFFGFRLPNFFLNILLSVKVQNVFEKMDIFLGILTIVDAAVSGLMKLFL